MPLGVCFCFFELHIILLEFFRECLSVVTRPKGLLSRSLLRLMAPSTLGTASALWRIKSSDRQMNIVSSERGAVKSAYYVLVLLFFFTTAVARINVSSG